MKASNFFFTALFLCNIFVGQAQSTLGPNVWLGTGYGIEGDWENPANWSKGHVPTEMEVVLIPDLSNKGRAIYPNIRGEVEIGRLILQPGARLSIDQEGALLVDLMEGPSDFSAHQIQNKGVLLLPNMQVPAHSTAPDRRLGMLVHQR